MNLKEQILQYFKASLNGINLTHNDETYRVVLRPEFAELDLFVYLFNGKQNYERNKATFNIDIQPERIDVLKRYEEDNNFYKFRSSMNKLLNNTYYIGHPESIKKMVNK